MPHPRPSGSEEHRDGSTSNAAVIRESSQLVSEGARRWLPGVAIMEDRNRRTRKHADVPQFVFSTAPCAKLVFRSPVCHSGQIFRSDVCRGCGTRDIWGCDSWRRGRGDGPKTKSAVVRQGQARQEETKANVTGQAGRRWAHGAMGKARLRRARRKYKGACVTRGSGREKVERRRSGQDWRESGFFPCA